MAQTPLSRKELEELLRLSNLLEKGLSRIDLENLNQSGDAARVMLESLRREAAEFTRDISSAAQGFRDVVEEINNSNIGVKEVNKSFNKLTSIVDKIQYHQKGISKLTEKEVEKLQQQAKQEKERLITASNLLNNKKAQLDASIQNNEAEIDSLLLIQNLTDDQISRLNTLEKQQEKLNRELAKTETAQNNISGIISDQDFHYNQLMSSIDNINNELNDTKQLLGLGGAAIGGLETALNKLGFGSLASKLGVDEAREKMEETAESIRLAGGDVNSFGNKFKVLGAGLKSIGSSIISNLKDPLIVVSFIIEGLIDAIKSLDTGAGDLAKNMNMTYNEALNLQGQLTQIANMSGDIAVTTRGMRESYLAIGQSLGAQVDMNAANLELMTQLRERAGVSNETFIEMSKYAASTGQEVEKATTGFLGGAKAIAMQAGKALNVKQLMIETSKVSNAIKLSIKGGAQALGEAAAKAKLVGMNLEQADNAASSLLNFEESITAELEAELLTGKDLNLERAHLAALNNDYATVAEEIARNVGSAAEFSNMNRLQQEAIAKSVGMQRDELANVLVEQEALRNLGRKLTDEEQAAYEFAKEKYGAKKAAEMLGKKELEDMKNQMNMQEKFNATVEKLKEIFITVADALMPVFSILSGVAEIVGFILQPIQGIFNIISALIDPTKGLSETLAEMGPVTAGIAVALGIAATAITAQMVPGLIKAGVAAATALIPMAANAVAAITTASAMTLGIGAVAIIAGIAAAVVAMNSAKSTALKDGMIGPDGGLMVSGKKGTYSLDANDTVIAGTNLNKPTTSSAGGSNIDLSPLLEEMRAVKQEVARMAARPIVVENKINNTDFGTAVASNTYTIA